MNCKNHYFLGVLLLFLSNLAFAETITVSSTPISSEFQRIEDGWAWPQPADRLISITSTPYLPALSGNGFVIQLDSSVNGVTYIINENIRATSFEFDTRTVAEDGSEVECLGGAMNGHTTLGPGQAMGCYTSLGYRAKIYVYNFKVFYTQEIINPRDIDSENKCPIAANSFIDVDALALHESIPLVGVPFELNYSSDRLRSDSAFNPKSLGLGGWTPSILHKYVSTKPGLYLGNNGYRGVSVPATASGYLLTDSSGTEVYYFDTSGKHIETKNAQTGLKKFSFIYDSQDRIYQISDRFNNTTTFTYLANSVQMTSPYGKVTTLAIDANNMLASVTNPNSETYSLIYNNQLLTDFTRPNGHTSRAVYNADGALYSDTGAGGDSFTLTSSLDNSTYTQTVLLTTQLGRTTSHAVTSFRSQVSRSQKKPDGSNSSSLIIYDSGSQSEDEYKNISEKEFALDPQYGPLVKYTRWHSLKSSDLQINATREVSKSADLSNPNDPFSFTQLITTTRLQEDASRTFTTKYDKIQNRITSLSPQNRVIYENLNANGQLSALQVGSLLPTYFNYDLRGRLDHTIQGDRRLQLAYDSAGNLSSHTDHLGRTTQYIYNSADRLVQQILPNATSISLSYDLSGNLTGITPAGKPQHQFTYNLFDMVENYFAPSGILAPPSSNRYYYNLDRQLTRIENGSASNYINLNYNQSTGLLNQISTPQGNYNYSYFLNSDLISQITAPSGSHLKYSYIGHLVSETSQAGLWNSTLKWNYNPDASLKSLTLVDSANQYHAVSFNYDKDGLLIQAGNEIITLNNVGAVASTKHNIISQAITYNSYGEILTDEFKKRKAGLFYQSYTRDKLGRITLIQNPPLQIKGKSVNQDRAFDYDVNGRLVKVTDSNQAPRTYTYDGNSNRLSKTTSAGTTNYAYDEQDRLLSAGSVTYAYNTDGSLKSKTDTTTSVLPLVTNYNYDVYGNLLSVQLPNNTNIEYIIDGQNRRVGKKVNGILKQIFVYQDQTRIAAELDGTGKLVKRFIYGAKLNVPDIMIYKGREYRIISDHVGSPRMIVNSKNGTVLESISYDEFGNPSVKTGLINLPFGFAGGIYDADTGLVRFGARDYDPSVGRWLSKDPIGFNGGDTNLYGYVLQDPVNLVDPEGKNAVAPILLTLPIVLYLIDKGIDALPCKDPQACLNIKTLDKLKDVEKSIPPKPGQCQPPKNPRPNAPWERKRV